MAIYADCLKGGVPVVAPQFVDQYAIPSRRNDVSYGSNIFVVRGAKFLTNKEVFFGTDTHTWPPFVFSKTGRFEPEGESPVPSVDVEVRKQNRNERSAVEIDDKGLLTSNY